MLVIEKDKINELIEELAKKSPVFVPAKRINGERIFEQWLPENNVDLEYSTTILPAKEFFIQPKEKIFVFDKRRRKIHSAADVKNFILFGLNLRDTEALVQLDEIMKKPEADYFYFQKRNRATVISVISEGGAIPHIGIDLILEKINEKEYKAMTLTEKGKKIVRSSLFREVENPERLPFPKSETMPRLRELLLDAELLHDAVKWSWKNFPEIWEDLKNRCLACGICAYVCPLCYCFSVDDSNALNDSTCARCRYWTACTLPEFSRITGGYNFHKTLKERYYNWFYHKFVRAYTEYGKSQCVACGRCQKYCPAKINIEEVLIDITQKYKSSQ